MTCPIEGECYREPWCEGLHPESLHSSLVAERERYASVFEGCPETGECLILFWVMPFLDFIRSALPGPRCEVCGVIGPNCEPRIEGNVISYCGID